MKNHFIYLIGIIILIITIWLTTMAGINANKQKEETSASSPLICDNLNDDCIFDLFMENVKKFH